jgi:hypothetical protein
MCQFANRAKLAFGAKLVGGEKDNKKIPTTKVIGISF